MKQAVFMFFMLVNGYAMAEVVFPPNCQGIADVGPNWVINALKPSLYLIYNDSDNDIWLTHSPKDPGASAGWASKVSTGKWSALLMDRKGFAFNCTESRPGHEQRAACGDVIAICQQQARLPEKNEGAYWVSEDLELKQLLSAIQRRGIYPVELK